MIIRIDQASTEPIYLQIRSQIVAGIARGELVPGDALPSVRSLASDLGINLHTVNKAYAVLRDEGYVTMRGRRGAFVADYQAQASEGRRAKDSARIAETVRQAALEHRACGGSRESFETLIHLAISDVFTDRSAS